LKINAMKKILFPTDFSSASLSALDFTVQLCRYLDAKIDLIHVFSVPFADASATPPQYIEELVTRKRVEVEGKLEVLAEKHGGVIRKTEAVYGFFTAIEIEEYAEEHENDLIAMGTRGEHTLMEKYLGSITSEVIIRASMPVIAIPEKAAFRQGGKIAYASDHQPNERIALDALKEIAKQLESPLYWVHVHPNSEETEVSRIPVTSDSDPDIALWHIVKAPSVMKGLDAYIEQEDISWLALFIPRRRLFERLFHSSFTRKMSMHTHVPMIVFCDRK